ncbi:transglycosylase family protein [Patulibacter brassicae]|uniref:Transglycosylase family protein n=1 Tax=Patulibacter brassicae TaxID=1705717 RepID=A0ABU4VHW4_9ACTN|nr:transglycosylase family protein [Patulibacter brassicae]MDX8151404.1 transglycosylase family protein [Patulibacter brassicae]
MTHDRDLASTLPWARSQRASRARRAIALRRRTWSRRRRTVATTLAVAVLGVGGVAGAQQATGGGSGKATATISVAGASVKQIQKALGVTADGVAGPKTRSAVRRFQRQKGLQVDGIVGPVTLEALGLSAAARSTTRSKGAGASASGSSNATLERIAACESGGDPTAVSASGQYRGKYQFDRQTWRAHGGSGDPAAAPEAEQDRIAARLLAARGTQPWPVCGKR